MPYRDHQAVLVQRLAELDAERRDLQKRLALFARPPAARPPRPPPVLFALAGVLAAAIGLFNQVQTARIGVRLPSGRVVFLFDGQFGTEHALLDLGP